MAQTKAWTPEAESRAEYHEQLHVKITPFASFKLHGSAFDTEVRPITHPFLTKAFMLFLKKRFSKGLSDKNGAPFLRICMYLISIWPQREQRGGVLYSGLAI